MNIMHLTATRIYEVPIPSGLTFDIIIHIQCSDRLRDTLNPYTITYQRQIWMIFLV